MSRAESLKRGYTDGARRVAARSMLGLARTRVTPNALTACGVALCVVAAVLVFFENRDELVFYWLGAAAFVVGSILDILDGALARTSGKGTPFGAFLDSTTDRVSEAAMLGAIALVFARHGETLALALDFAAVAGSFLVSVASWTYWNSEFTVVGLALLWVYLRRNEAFGRFRNVVLLANGLGLIGYVLLPTAPPRMFPEVGFVDTLATFGGLHHGSGLVELASNPYAAMPSLHAADALLVGLVLASIARRWPVRVLWLLWPVWVWFCVMATGNHFWLDVLAGNLVAVLAAAVVYHRTARRLVAKLL